MTFDPTALCGWSDVAERHVMAATMPTFSQAAPRLMAGAAGAGDADLLLYLAMKETIGSYFNYVAQTIGDCESHGHGHGNDLLQCVEYILAGGAKGGLKQDEIETSTEFLYGAGREAGNMLGWQDGAYGSAMVKAMTEIGMIPRSMTGPYSGKKAKDWGYRGCPSDLKEKAAKWKLGGKALVQNTDELKAAFLNGYPVSVSSGQGFSMVRDQDGFCHAQGSWPHCMLLCGMRFGSRPGVLIMNSWGMEAPSGPLALDQPTNTFWAEMSVVNRMLAQQDSWALSKSPFFVERPLPSNWTYSRAA
jgi:hypothetical protein